MSSRDLTGPSYRGVPVPPVVRRAANTGFQDDAYLVGWQDGVDAVLTRLGDTAEQEPGRDLDDGGHSYRGVTLPGAWASRGQEFRDTWQDAVDNAHEAWRATAQDTDGTAGQDTTLPVLRVPERDVPLVQAFCHLVGDDPDKAQDIVVSLSPKDRAILSFYCTEMSSTVDTVEMSRRTAF